MQVWSKVRIKPFDIWETIWGIIWTDRHDQLAYQEATVKTILPGWQIKLDIDDWFSFFSEGMLNEVIDAGWVDGNPVPSQQQSSESVQTQSNVEYKKTEWSTEWVDGFIDEMRSFVGQYRDSFKDEWDFWRFFFDNMYKEIHLQRAWIYKPVRQEMIEAVEKSNVFWWECNKKNGDKSTTKTTNKKTSKKKIGEALKKGSKS